MTGRRMLAGAVALVLVLAGCAGHPDLAADRATTLQGEVLAVTTAAAAGNWDGADAGVAALHTQLDAAKSAGDVSTARYDEIDAALQRVSSEVSTARAAAQAAADQAAAAQAAADQAAAAAPQQPTASTGAKAHPAPGNSHKPKKNK